MWCVCLCVRLFVIIRHLLKWLCAAYSISKISVLLFLTAFSCVVFFHIIRLEFIGSSTFLLLSLVPKWSHFSRLNIVFVIVLLSITFLLTFHLRLLIIILNINHILHRTIIYLLKMKRSTLIRQSIYVLMDRSNWNFISVSMLPLLLLPS